MKKLKRILFPIAAIVLLQSSCSNGAQPSETVNDGQVESLVEPGKKKFDPDAFLAETAEKVPDRPIEPPAWMSDPVVAENSFDPDAYLKKHGVRTTDVDEKSTEVAPSSFDPKAFLAEHAEKAPDRPVEQPSWMSAPFVDERKTPPETHPEQEEADQSAIRMFQEWAEQGDAWAQATLGTWYLTGDGVPKDPTQAVYWFRKAAEQGDADAQFQLGLCYAMGRGVEKDNTHANTWLQKAAENGHADAQYLLAGRYAGGVGVPKDSQLADYWYGKAAEQGDAVTWRPVEHEEYLEWAKQGDASAQTELGIIYRDGRGVPKDLVQAAYWFRKAAEQGDAWAQSTLGTWYAFGRGVPQDYAQAVQWFRMAAEQGRANAQYSIGVCYRDGTGVQQSHTQAFLWFQKAATQGHAAAQFGLAQCYKRGDGVRKNLPQAAHWFRMAAEQGDALAQANLGSLYDAGEGVSKDLVQAAYWFRKAAEQGDSISQLLLAIAYQRGDGVPQDHAQAAYWLRKAAEQGQAAAHLGLARYYRSGRGVVQDDVKACAHFLVAGALGRDTVADVMRLRNERLTAAGYEAARQKANDWMASLSTRESPLSEKFNEPRRGQETEALRGSGTGFIISADGHFLTCAHVVEGARSIVVRIGANSHPARILHTDSRNDVALLKLDGAGFTPIPLAGQLPEMGDRVFTVGFPNPEVQGASAKYTDGVVSSFTGLMDDIRTMQISVPVQPGNSGGALMDAAGNAVGIVVAQINAATVFQYTGTIPQNVNFAVKIGYAKPLIQSVTGLSRALPQSGPPRPGTRPVENATAATGLVIVYE